MDFKGGLYSRKLDRFMRSGSIILPVKSYHHNNTDKYLVFGDKKLRLSIFGKYRKFGKASWILYGSLLSTSKV